MSRRRTVAFALALAAVPAALAAAPLEEAPVLSREVPRGAYSTVALPETPPSPKTVDGQDADWTGEFHGFAGAVARSVGELVYVDHLFDAYGPDNGRDAERMGVLDPLAEAVPETYRLDATQQADLPGEFGIPVPDALRASTNYGDLAYRGARDLVELRIAADDTHLWLLGRTAQLAPGDRTALLVLVADPAAPATSGEVPFAAGLRSRATTAVLLSGQSGWIAAPGGAPAALADGSVATNPAGFADVIEARIPLDALPRADRLELVVATGALEGDGAPVLADLGGGRLANVAFRSAEPVREWFDKRQALALHAGSIDEFLLEVNLDALRAGASERLVPGPGYHERVFVSTTPGLAEARDREGLYQHYGVYLPSGVPEGAALPLQWWLHWRGGSAHAGAALSPGIFRDFGEQRGAIVVSPRGRGTSTWYVGRGHADVLEVWDDVAATFPVDWDRVYVSGHSMGGWGSWLLSVLYPDRFAAALPVAGPPTQGAWTGLDFPGCENYRAGEYSLCYIEANGSRPRDQHTRRLLENLRNVPVGVFHGAADELVPVSGVTRQVERLTELGYRHRYYLFPTYEHYSHPINDQWAEGARYLDGFRRDPNPSRVTYVRDVAFERAVEEVQSGGIPFAFDFDRAYWMSELTPAAGAAAARFDGQTLARPAAPVLVVPEAGGPASLGQTGPYTMNGLGWLANPVGATAEARNAFTAVLAGASQVRLDLPRMGIDVDEGIEGQVSTDQPLTLRLSGEWRGLPDVTLDGAPVPVTLAERVVTVQVPAGGGLLTLVPRGVRNG